MSPPLSAAQQEQLKVTLSLADAYHDSSVLDIRRSLYLGLNRLGVEVEKLTITKAELLLLETDVSPCSSTTPTSIAPTLVCDTTVEQLCPPKASEGTAMIVEKEESTAQFTPRVASIKDFEIIKIIGKGASAQVYLVRDIKTNERRAMKVIPKAALTVRAVASIQREQKILRLLTEADSPWFLKLDASFHDTRNFYFVFPFYPTDLESEIIRRRRFSKDRSQFYYVQLYLALTELHSLGILHRDIKPANLLLDRRGNLVIADFGLSMNFGQKPTWAERMFQPYWPYARGDVVTPDTPLRVPEALPFVTRSQCGTPDHLAPEVYRREPHSFGVDHYGAATCLYTMLTGRIPFGNNNDGIEELRRKIMEDDLIFTPEDNLDEEAKDFLQQMMAKKPKDRLRLTDLESHPFFVGVNWPLMERHSIPAPIIPRLDTQHTIHDTVYKFTPGEPYEDVDPYPNFGYTSPSVQAGIVRTEDLISNVGKLRSLQATGYSRTRRIRTLIKRAFKPFTESAQGLKWTLISPRLVVSPESPGRFVPVCLSSSSPVESAPLAAIGPEICEACDTSNPILVGHVVGVTGLLSRLKSRFE